MRTLQKTGADVATAIARGYLSRKITVDVKGEILQLKNTINTMVDQLNAFASEVSRVAREVGTDGKLGGQAVVTGVAGTWAQTLDAVNTVIDDLVRPTAEVARVIDAVADGDLSQKMALTIEGRQVKGEFARIARTVNAMLDQLSSFASEVSRVARASAAPGRTSPTTSTRWRPTSPGRCATSPT